MTLMLRFLCLILITLSLSEGTWAQDERLFRELLIHSKKEKLKNRVEKVYRIKARSNRHFVDLTADNRPESLITAKRDGEDWLQIYNDKGEEVFRSFLQASGPWSRLFKIQIRRLNDKTKVLLLYFYEGVTRYLEFQGTTRLYFLTYEENKLESLKLYKGPLLWDEKRGFKDHYHQKKYEVSFYDLDGDRTREVSISYGRMNRVFKYLGKGEWFNFDDQNSLKSF